MAWEDKGMRRALITGITGQDGSYLTELLLSLGYEVHGLIRRSSTFNTDRIDHLYVDPHTSDARLFLHYADLSDGTGLRHVLEGVMPHEVYNLAAQSHVAVSFQQAEYTADVDGLGVLRLLEAIRDLQKRTGEAIRFYQAGTSEMFGGSPPPQSEATRFYPKSPYAAAKVMAHHLVINYRESYGLHASNGILFNHESERRGETFVTRKITRAATRIKEGLQDTLYLGNLDAKRDWGHAEDYVRAMHLMLQQDAPDDYVIATGESYSVRTFVEKVFTRLGLDWQRHVRIDPRYYRPAEVDFLQGDSSKARKQLGWEPRVGIDELVQRMVDFDLELARQERTLREAGHAVTTRGMAGA
jgi:GDPmannose 4,6-dehydratase